jgi:preprotein translocase subunit SecD
MKSIIYLVVSIVIAITLTSAVQKTSESARSITLQSTGNNVGSESLKRSADIISARLKLYGLSSFEVKVSADKGQVIIKFQNNTDISEIEGLLTSRGELAFYETYTHNEIADLLKPENPLFNLLANHLEEKPSDPRVGCSGTESRKKADEYIRSSVPLRNCKLFWGFESEKSGYCLFALKTDDAGKPLLVRSDVESVKIATSKDSNNPKIQIKLKPSAISIFADATKKNLNKAIAIIIDDKVYSWPVVKSVIEGGEIEVTGSFTEKEATYFPVLFNSEPLPLSFKLLR